MITARLFSAVRRDYAQKWGCDLALIDLAGRILDGHPGCEGCSTATEGRDLRKRALLESLRWGEPCVNVCSHGLAYWAAPLMLNSEVTGGLLVAGVRLEEADNQKGRGDHIRRAAAGLLDLAESRNLTNGALLRLNREHAEAERRKAEGIHELKRRQFESLRELYLREEPLLIAAVKKGDRGEARNILNRILVSIYFSGRERLGYLKSLVLELVVMIYRAAIEAGAEEQAMLGADYVQLSRLAAIDDHESLSRWLREVLERLMDGIRTNTRYANSTLLSNALAYISENLGRQIGREEVATAAGLSPSHFSHLIREQLGSTFSDVLRRARVDEACRLLSATDKELVQVAFETGFCDQSYFSRVFKLYTGFSPKSYRDRARVHTRVEGKKLGP
jgi:AraC-like DNA-binding protein